MVFCKVLFDMDLMQASSGLEDRGALRGAQGSNPCSSPDIPHVCVTAIPQNSMGHGPEVLDCNLYCPCLAEIDV